SAWEVAAQAAGRSTAGSAPTTSKIFVRLGQVLVEFGEATSVGSARGGIEQGCRASFCMERAGQFQYVHIGAGSGE
ncbi:MAG TPA: hypothetical protein VGR74_10345, partial [Actinomycetota bacterium]|nr:hypothetical protein [Actinomycetota bacterium]